MAFYRRSYHWNLPLAPLPLGPITWSRLCTSWGRCSIRSTSFAHFRLFRTGQASSGGIQQLHSDEMLLPSPTGALECDCCAVVRRGWVLRESLWYERRGEGGRKKSGALYSTRSFPTPSRSCFLERAPSTLKKEITKQTRIYGFSDVSNCCL